jgi:hypothetical protein
MNTLTQEDLENMSVEMTDKVQRRTTGLRETNEQTMIEAHKAGMAFWRQAKLTSVTDVARHTLEWHARTCGWHGADNIAWIAGYYGAMARDHF